MRQLIREGYMHNRARLIVASFMTSPLHDWRQGARLFWDLLADGEIASDAGNWRWVAGTGTTPAEPGLRPGPPGAPLRPQGNTSAAMSRS